MWFIKPWMAAKFNLEIQSVVSMRLMKIAAGGAEAAGRLPPPRLHHPRQVGTAGDKILAHTHPSRVSRNHGGIDAALWPL